MSKSIKSELVARRAGLLSTNEAAEYTGYSSGSFRNLCCKGQGPAPSMRYGAGPGGACLYDKAELDRWLAARVKAQPALVVAAPHTVSAEQPVGQQVELTALCLALHPDVPPERLRRLGVEAGLKSVRPRAGALPSIQAHATSYLRGILSNGIKRTAWRTLTDDTLYLVLLLAAVLYKMRTGAWPQASSATRPETLLCGATWNAADQTLNARLGMHLLELCTGSARTRKNWTASLEDTFAAAETAMLRLGRPLRHDDVLPELEHRTWGLILSHLRYVLRTPSGDISDDVLRAARVREATEALSKVVVRAKELGYRPPLPEAQAVLLQRLERDHPDLVLSECERTPELMRSGRAGHSDCATLGEFLVELLRTGLALDPRLHLTRTTQLYRVSKGRRSRGLENVPDLCHINGVSALKYEVEAGCWLFYLDGSTLADARPWLAIRAAGDHVRLTAAKRVAFLDWSGGIRPVLRPWPGAVPDAPPGVRRFGLQTDSPAPRRKVTDRDRLRAQNLEQVAADLAERPPTR